MKLFTLFLTNALTKKNEAKINVFLTTPLKNAFFKKAHLTLEIILVHYYL